ncbi:butyrophilin subfamily 3 member A2-like [Opisthocomus hoazin]|uniref:butyrophilin subfamily 3 member A2-like n=1 Tax=Opisthocomus hoazin TaxID=30419 RepID=UPI003F53C10A
MERRRWLSFAMALLVAIPLSENFEVTSPQNVVGIVGLDTTLPCHISSTKPLDNIEVQWKKVMDGHIENIHIYRQFDGKQKQQYPGRTSLPTDGFATGNVSLTMKSVQPADEGTYSCFVKSKDWSADTATVLSIAGDVLSCQFSSQLDSRHHLCTGTSEVFFEILGPQGHGIELTCRSHGWYPKPTVQWVTQNKQSLSPDTAIHQDSKQLFSVLSRVTVTGEEVGDVTCQILNPLVQAEKKAIVRLSSAVFPRVSPWLTAFWILFTLVLLALAAGAFLLFRDKKRASKEKSDEENALQEQAAESFPCIHRAKLRYSSSSLT